MGDGFALQLIESRRELGQFGLIGIEIDHLVERGSCRPYAFPIEGLANRIDAAINTPPPRSLFERHVFRNYFRRSWRRLRRGCGNDRLDRCGRSRSRDHWRRRGWHRRGHRSTFRRAVNR
jgi:hypothetical protein